MSEHRNDPLDMCTTVATIGATAMDRNDSDMNMHDIKIFPRRANPFAFISLGLSIIAFLVAVVGPVVLVIATSSVFDATQHNAVGDYLPIFVIAPIVCASFALLSILLGVVGLRRAQARLALRHHNRVAIVGIVISIIVLSLSALYATFFVV